MLLLIISFFYFAISQMIFAGLPFVYFPAETGPYDGFSGGIAGVWTGLYIVYFLRINKLAMIIKLLLLVVLTPVFFCILLFLLKTISKIMIIYPVIPETLSGVAILSGYCLTILAVIIIPNSYILDKIIAKKYCADYLAVKIPPGWNGKMLFPVIGLITDVILPLFLLYNIVYRNPHLYILFFSTVITRIAYFMLTSKHNPKLSRVASISIRIISFPVLCASLVVMIVTGTGNWPVGWFMFNLLLR